MKVLHRALPILVVFVIAGCAGSGGRVIWEHKLKDDSVVQYLQTKTYGHSGPDVTVVEAYHCPPDDGACHLQSRYSAGAAGLWESAMSGAVGMAVMSGGIAGAGALIRPDRTSIHQGVTGTSSAGSSAGATAGAASFSKSDARSKALSVPRRRH